MKSSRRGNLMLTLTAFIWGTAFVAQSVGMDHVGPFTFGGLRFILGGLVLLPVVALTKPRGQSLPAMLKDRTLLQGGAACGVVLFLASTSQQFGLKTTTAGKAGFITALYIIIVPLAGLFWGRKASRNVWLGVLLAAAGLYLLCVRESLRPSVGDLAVLLSAFIFSAHILVIDHYAPRVNGVLLSCCQFFVAGILGLVSMVLFEKPSLQAISACWLPLMYTGIFSCGVAYTLQILGQKHTHPAMASLIFSLEAVFAAIAGWLLLGQSLTPRESLGALLMFAAIVLAQRPGKQAQEYAA